MSPSRYILLEPLGADGAWVRYRAVHRAHGTPHLARVRAGVPAAGVERLTSLVHLQRANRHPGLVPVERLIRTGTTLTAIAPWVDGVPLAAVLASMPLLPTEATAILADVGAIVAVAHGWGVPHGTLSPDHVMLVGTEGDLSVLVDGFGLAAADRDGLSPDQDLRALAALAQALGAPTLPGPPAESSPGPRPWSPALLARVRAGAASLAMDADVSMHSFLPEEPAPDPAPSEPWWRRMLR